MSIARFALLSSTPAAIARSSKSARAASADAFAFSMYPTATCGSFSYRAAPRAKYNACSSSSRRFLNDSTDAEQLEARFGEVLQVRITQARRGHDGCGLIAQLDGGDLDRPRSEGVVQPIVRGLELESVHLSEGRRRLSKCGEAVRGAKNQRCHQSGAPARIMTHGSRRSAS